MASIVSKIELDIEKIRADFPILERELRPGIKLVYLGKRTF